MLPSTVTLNVGNPAADVTFESPIKNGESVVYHAASPNDDLSGRVALKVSHEETKSGSVRTLAQVKIPQWNADKGQYTERPVQVNLVCSREGSTDLDETDRALEIMQEFLATTNVRRAIAERLTI